MKIKEGDVFTLRVEDNGISVGQILQKNRHDIYLVIFSKLYESIADIKSDFKTLINDTPAIVGRTSELFFSLKRWNVIGNCSKADDINFYPNYKIETLEGVFITNFDLQVIRKATKEEEDFYFFHNHVSPAYIVSAVMAHHGLREMDRDYIKLTYDYVKRRSNRLN